MDEIITDDQRKLVDDVREKLMEHFDSVRIFVTRHDGGNAETCSYETGGGNFYAQLGQISEFMAIQDQYQRNHAIREDKKK